jgi:hypothetical protein
MYHHVAQLVLASQQLGTKRLDFTLHHVKRLLLRMEIALPTACIPHQERHLEVQRAPRPTLAKSLRSLGLQLLVVVPRLEIRQLAYTPRQEAHLGLGHQANLQPELEHLLFPQLVPQRVIQPLLVYTPRQERQAHPASQTSLQYDSLFPQEVLLVQEMATRLFSPYIPISGLLQLVVLEHLTTQFSTQTLEPLKVQVLQPQVTLP